MSECNRYEVVSRLRELGIERHDAEALRRISMTLHSWFELECGTERGCIERDGENSDGRPFWHPQDGIDRKYKIWIPDRERGAYKRLARIMSRYPSLSSYVQGDPRGASLYILRPGDVPEGQDPDAYYSRGIAVYK